jgi:hypothetical protein
LLNDGHVCSVVSATYRSGHVGYKVWFLIVIELFAFNLRSLYEVVSKIFRTGTAIYTAVVVAQRICPNRPNCEFRVLMRRFAATAWKRAKTSPWTLARTDLAASPWQRPVSRFRPHPAVSGGIKNDCYPHPPILLPWFGTLWLLPISKNEIEAERSPVWYHRGDVPYGQTEG